MLAYTHMMNSSHNASFNGILVLCVFGFLSLFLPLWRFLANENAFHEKRLLQYANVTFDAWDY